MLRPSKIRAFASTFMASSCISSLRRPAAAAEAPLRREPLVVVAHGAAQALVEGLTVELEGRGVGLHLAAHRLEPPGEDAPHRSEEHTSELQSLMRISYAAFCLTNKTIPITNSSSIRQSNVT